MTKNSDSLQLIPASFAAELLGVSPPTFYRLVEELEDLKPITTLGGSRLWSLNKVLAYVKKRDDEERARRDALVAKWKEEAEQREAG